MNTIDKIQAARQASAGTLDVFISKNRATFEKFIIGTKIDFQDLTRLALTTYKRTPGLAKCDPASIMAALIESIQLGLKPNTVLGHAYIIPYKNYAQFQVGYKGILQFAYRTGSYRRIDAHEVKEGDYFKYKYGTAAFVDHQESEDPKREQARTTHIYAIYELANGGGNFEVWSIEKINAHRDRYSRTSSKDTPWYTAPDEMGKKTVLKSLLKYAPQSDELMRLLVSDESIKTQFPEHTNKMSEVAPDYDAMNYLLTQQPEEPQDEEKKPPKETKTEKPEKGPEITSEHRTSEQNEQAKKGILKVKTGEKAPPLENEAHIEETATEGQRKMLFVMASQAGLKTEDFKNRVKAKYNLESFSDLPKDKVNEIITELTGEK